MYKTLPKAFQSMEWPMLAIFCLAYLLLEIYEVMKDFMENK